MHGSSRLEAIKVRLFSNRRLELAYKFDPTIQEEEENFFASFAKIER